MNKTVEGGKIYMSKAGNTISVKEPNNIAIIIVIINICDCLFSRLNFEFLPHSYIKKMHTKV